MSVLAHSHAARISGASPVYNGDATSTIPAAFMSVEDRFELALGADAIGRVSCVGDQSLAVRNPARPIRLPTPSKAGTPTDRA
jgi:hypothetical protein